MKPNTPEHNISRVTAGFTLIELMIVVVVATILATLSYPSYIHFVQKADRSSAQTTLQDWANRQQVWRADHPVYNAGINPSDTGKYTYSMVSNATSFTLTATAIGRQVDDKQDGVSCAILTLRQDGSTGPDGNQPCWGK